MQKVAFYPRLEIIFKKLGITPFCNYPRLEIYKKIFSGFLLTRTLTMGSIKIHGLDA